MLRKLMKKVLANFPFKSIPLVRSIAETQETQTPITLSKWMTQKIFRINADVPWPTHFTSLVNNPKLIKIGVDTSPGYMPGCYIQGGGGIRIGDYTQIGPQVGILSINHDPCDNRKSLSKGPIDIGSYCWLGMRSVILPGVKLGDFTVVAAGAVVTKSFEEGYCVIAGVPASIIRKLDPTLCVRYRNRFEYCGYYPVKP